MKRILKNLFRKIGLEVNKLNTDNSGSFPLGALIKLSKISPIDKVDKFK